MFPLCATIVAMTNNDIEPSYENDDFEVKQTDSDDVVYQCKTCEFSSKSKPGVKQHVSRMHKKKQVEADKSLDVEAIERELRDELEISENEEDFQPPGIDPNIAAGFEFIPPNSQADFNLNVTKLFESHEMEKENQDDAKNVAETVQSTPKVATVSWRSKFEEKENEVTLMTVKMAALEQKLREKDNELEGKDDVIEKHVKTVSENLEQIRMLEVELKSKDELLQTALAQVDSVDIQSRNDNSNKCKEEK